MPILFSPARGSHGILTGDERHPVQRLKGVHAMEQYILFLLGLTLGHVMNGERQYTASRVTFSLTV